jgi:hypothetical protein
MPQVILKAVLLRRTKMTLIDGKPLITLPKREIFMVTSVFLDAYVVFILSSLRIRHPEPKRTIESVMNEPFTRQSKRRCS